MTATSSSSNAERKVAIVTGAGTNIGKAAALALSADGYAVVLAGRRKEPLEETAREAGAIALVVPTDVSDPDSVSRLFAETKQAYGRLDLLFNNAGVMPSGVPLEDLSFDNWNQTISVNVTGAFLCTQAAIRLMKSQDPQGGRIINNGSVSAHAPRPDTAAYTVSKHAMTGLTRSTSLDGRKYNIACGQIDIGNAGDKTREMMAAGARQPSGRIEPEPAMDVLHVGRAIAYMASLPLDTNVQFMTLMATKMPFIGRG